MWLRSLCAALVALMWLTGCETLSPKPGDQPQYKPVQPPAPIPQAFNNGAIYQAASSNGLFEDYKARRVGDLLTILLVERTNARKSASTSVSKDSELEVNVGQMEIAGRPITQRTGSLFGLTGNNNRAFDGAGDSAQSNQLDGEITVTVAEVLSNGNLVVQGEKWLGINQGKEYVRLRGIVRPVDITAANTVNSTQVANVEVYYGGTGAVADSNAMGWFMRFFMSALLPF
jgi:flagellar L-ring protein precursor FlgH